jgi:hypothetical protein
VDDDRKTWPELLAVAATAVSARPVVHMPITLVVASPAQVEPAVVHSITVRRHHACLVGTS